MPAYVVITKTRTRVPCRLRHCNDGVRGQIRVVSVTTLDCPSVQLDARTSARWLVGAGRDTIAVCGSGSPSRCTASSTGSFLAPSCWRDRHPGGDEWASADVAVRPHRDRRRDPRHRGGAPTAAARVVAPLTDPTRTQGLTAAPACGNVTRAVTGAPGLSVRCVLRRCDRRGGGRGASGPSGAGLGLSRRR